MEQVSFPNNRPAGEALLPAEPGLPHACLPGEFRRTTVLFAVMPILILSVGGFTSLRTDRVSAPIPMSLAPTAARPPARSGLNTIVGHFQRNGNITDTLTRHGLDRNQVLEMVRDSMPVYNLARIAAGRPYWVDVSLDNQLRVFRYLLDDERYLTVYRQQHRYVPEIKSLPFVTKIEPVSGIVRDSLISAAIASGEEERLALDIAEIFMWDIDFYTDLQPGDSFRLLIEKKYLDGKFRKYGAILAAGFTNQGREFTAFRFEGRPGVFEYFDRNGRALKKSFLKSPLKYARVTSRFSGARMHPVLRIVRPHLGVDYAAPEGTPVVAVGSGTVISAGSSPQGGKMVRIRHAGAYETYYLHLMRIAVRPGAQVSQSQLIGYVGSTGLSTGPHLDFRITQHGRFINPARVIFPPSPPVPADSVARFAALRDPLLRQLDATPAPQAELRPPRHPAD